MLSEVTVSTLPGRRHETSTIADGSTVVLALTRVALRSGHHCPRIGDARRMHRAASVDGRPRAGAPACSPRSACRPRDDTGRSGAGAGSRRGDGGSQRYRSSPPADSCANGRRTVTVADPISPPYRTSGGE